MIRASAHGLGTPRAADWRESAACLGEDPELFFPLGTEGPSALQIEQAKAVCARCPVMRDCLVNALQTNASDGIFGGLTKPERDSLRRREARARNGESPRQPRPNLPRPKTLREALDQRTQTTDDGHALWTGRADLEFQGERYTVTHLAFELGYGRKPVGLVRRTCKVKGCVRWDHLTDQVMRDAEDRCGTRSGYLRHRARGEDCERCRRANTDADNRLRRTGTTKVTA